ncbi:glycosyl hydrolase superfamily protein [Artemisia annua]|uniref:Glycosyl hydrolase superfamily protein n=1 Tax=Artemisia annua TaxID=35608 RepID=A0A2U1NIZ9_ARTAN|nr:glycosyl hydrolase superfamily protein [Artemisia annua]
MELSLRSIFILQCVLGIILSLSGLLQVESLGINYGQLGDNLLPPEKVLQLLKSLRVTKTRIYDTNPDILSAFANSGVELIVTVENEKLGQLMDPQQALQWVTSRIKPYVPATKITGIAVGNEVFTGSDMSLFDNLVPAMVSIQRALTQLGLQQYIQVSTPSSLAVLANSYPPSEGAFTPELIPIMTQLLQFLSATRSPFWINAYPYFAYKDSPSKISIDYALFNPNSGMIDPHTNMHYDNMLYAQVDAVIFAMARTPFIWEKSMLYYFKLSAFAGALQIQSEYMHVERMDHHKRLLSWFCVCLVTMGIGTLSY